MPSKYLGRISAKINLLSPCIPRSRAGSNSLRRLCLGGLGLFSLAVSCAEAALLTGRVIDANTNAYLLGSTVAVKELGRSTSTEVGGAYSLSNLPAGTYTVTVSYLGYQDVTQTVTVSDGADNRIDFAVGREVVKMAALVVEGSREGQARALQQKRTSDNILDVVAADSVGKLPDGNAAEAVRRLPGVFAEIDQNEGRYIVVRGIDSSLNNVTINGVSVGSTESGTRGAAMDAVPADLISRIEVVKAVTPDMDHQAVGASVNIVTPSAFDRSETFAYGTIAGGYYNGPSNDMPYSASGTYGTTFGDRRWGVVVGASHSFRHYVSNRRSGGNPWYPAASGSDVYFPATEALFYYDVKRWRQGLNAALEFKPSDDHYFAFRVTDNRFKDEEGREQNNFEFFRTTYPASYTPTTATFTSGRSTVEYRYYLQKHNITNYSFEGRHTLLDGSGKLDYVVALGDAKKQTPDRQDWEFRSPTNISSTVDIAPEYWVVAPSSNFYDASNYPFRRVRFRHDTEKEDNYTLALNYRQEVSLFGHPGSWKVGGKYFSRDKSWDRGNTDYLAGTGSNLFYLSQSGISSPAHTLFDGQFAMSPQIDLDAIQDFFAANPQYFVYNAAGTQSDSYVTDFGFKEDIAAGYAMAKTEFGKLSILAGARVERSEGKVTQTELPTAGSTALNPYQKDFSKSYTNVMPGVHLRYELRKNWILRGAWTNTLGRPNYPDVAGSSSFTYVETGTGTGVYTGSVSSGNPDLKPYESMNFDLGSEYYFKHSGILSVSAFSKRIDNPIFTNAYTLRNTVYDGKTFESLSYSRPENADHGRINGVEFNYQLQLTMLPSPFDGLGFSTNFTLSDSEETLFTRPGESLPFAKQADKLYNIALFYEKYGFQVRVAYTHTGAFIKSFGSDVNSDQYQAERNIVDAKISYRIGRHVTVFADVINLGEEPLDEYAGFPNRNQATERYWWTANFGVNFNL